MSDDAPVWTGKIVGVLLFEFRVLDIIFAICDCDNESILCVII